MVDDEATSVAVAPTDAKLRKVRRLRTVAMVSEGGGGRGGVVQRGARSRRKLGGKQSSSLYTADHLGKQHISSCHKQTRLTRDEGSKKHLLL